MSLFFKSEKRMYGDWFATDSMPNTRRPSADSSVRLGSMFAAYRHIVDYASTLPVDCYRLDGPARKAAPLPQLLARQDQPGGPGLVPWLGQIAFGLATGNAVGWIQGIDGFGFPADIAWLHWSQWDYDEMAKQWTILGQPVQASQIVHIPWIVPPGRKLGLSPIEVMAAVITAGLSAQEYADLKRGGGIPPTMLKNSQKVLNADQAIEAQRRAKASFARGDVFVAGSDWDLSVMTVPPNQAQFVETLKMSANLIAAAFGLDPTELGGEKGNSQEYVTEELREIRRASDMRPYLTRIECGLSRYLPAKQYIKFNTDAYMRADIKTATDVIGAQIADGRMSVNEARELADREPVPGGNFHNIPTPLSAAPTPPPMDPTKARSIPEIGEPHDGR